MPAKDVMKSSEVGTWPIFVISLADSVKRRESIRAQLQALSMTAEIVDAVDGRKGLPLHLEHLIDRDRAHERMGRKMTGGEFACALSHQRIYQRILDEGLPGAIILEDDAILTPLFAEFLARKGYLAAEFVQMDHMYACVWRLGWRKFSKKIRLYRLAENAVLATGYSISAKAAHYIVTHSQPIAGIADWPCDLMPLSPVVTSPCIVGHPDAETSDSSLEEDRKVYLDELDFETFAPSRRGASRFLYASYWKRWLFKRSTTKIS